jgi:hypothetical protein
MKILAHLAVSLMLPATVSGRSCPEAPHSSDVAADGWWHDRIQLLPVNPAFRLITFEPEDAGDLTIVGEFVRVASRA